MERPDQLFSLAQAQGTLAELELHCQALAVRRFAAAGFSGKLFLNRHPGVLVNPAYPRGRTLSQLEDAGIKASDVVIELTERHVTEDYDVVIQAVEHYRAMGLTMALDDVGAGYNGLIAWAEVLPEYIKLDRELVAGVAENEVRRVFLGHILSLCRSLGAKLIVEGVESGKDLRVLQDCGVDYAQGFVLAKPSEEPLGRPDVERVHLLCSPGFHVAGEDSAAQSADAPQFARWVEPVPRDEIVENVWQRFEQHPDEDVIPVVDDARPLGVVTRIGVYEVFSKPFGRDLCGRRPVGSLLSPGDIATVTRGASLNAVSRRLAGDAGLSGQPYFIVVDRDGSLFGVGTTQDVLRALTDQRLESAQDANPLTGLPGNRNIGLKIRQIVHSGEEAVLAYLDIDLFKPFNDRFGFHAGDEMINALAGILRQKMAGPGHFVGHVGGDDFVVILKDPLRTDLLEQVQSLFSDAIQTQAGQYSTDEALTSAGYRGRDRSGHEKWLSWPTLSIGALHVPRHTAVNYDELMKAVARVKQEAKRVGGSGLACLALDTDSHGGPLKDG